ncbi:glutamine--fructose-6-phosphate transaminase (isomerizing) [Thermofilum pendens]|uniref:glutamine--fructose-6-phosphate transaminase (isomerizing) n=1 Tax=Thermofilum pendens TaxID=2269 RepID=UPI00069C5E63|nr:glutamine--fructose-6-phosphate transaminase (isomerizing) [Thermofilum pendens]
MCGIVGIVSEDLNVAPLVVECLRRLEYRGYDSVGVAVLDDGKLFVRKGAGKIDSVDSAKCLKCLHGHTGVGHTRWATHGPPTDENAHPHVDCTGRLAVVHNGILENYRELKSWLQERGHVFRSNTDTEVFAHLVEEYLKEEGDFFKAFKKSLKAIRGSYALAVVTSLEPRKIFFARKHSPLVIGIADGKMFVASDIPAFLEYTNKVVILNDGELGYVEPRGLHLETLEGGVVDVNRRVIVVPWTAELARKEGFPHYMLKEIHEQPRVIAETIRGFGPDYERGAELLSDAEVIYVVASGTSYHASLYFALLTMKIAGKKVIPLISSEYAGYVSSASERDALLAVSQSGETIDTLMAMRAFKERGVRTVSLTNVIGSVISRESDHQVYMKAGPEIGVAATKTFTVQLTALTWLSALIARNVGAMDEKDAESLLERMKKIPDLAEKVINAYSGWCKETGTFMSEKSSAYYLSRGLGLPIALEGALKLKEIAYVHAEGYPAGESKHGPIALVERGFPVVFVSVERELEKKLLGNVEEMRARGAYTIGVVPQDSELRGHFDREVVVPSSDEVAVPILATIPLQLVAYYSAVERGLDPDKPRNLAKTVTVE